MSVEYNIQAAYNRLMPLAVPIGESSDAPLGSVPIRKLQEGQRPAVVGQRLVAQLTGGSVLMLHDKQTVEASKPTPWDVSLLEAASADDPFDLTRRLVWLGTGPIVEIIMTKKMPGRPHYQPIERERCTGEQTGSHVRHIREIITRAVEEMPALQADFLLTHGVGTSDAA